MKHLLQRLFTWMATQRPGRPATARPGCQAMVLSFDGRVVRLKLPE